MLVLDGRLNRAYVALTGGRLAVVNLSRLEVEQSIPLGSDLEALAPGPEARVVYGSLNTGEVVRIDTISGEVTARAGGLGRPRGLAFDLLAGNLLVVDAKEGKIIRFSEDLSAHQAAYLPGNELPDQLLLDPASRRLYVTLPGARRVLALDADSLQPVAGAELVGGPLIEAALDAAHGRMYVLSALSPGYRGISALKADDLSSLALVAGSPAFPLKQATALAISPDGQLLLAEGASLYQISPEDFSPVTLARLEHPVRRGGLAADPTTGRIVWIDSAGSLNTLFTTRQF